jgi:hypothetical protein
MSYIFYKFNIIALDWALKIDSLLDNNEIYNLYLKMFLPNRANMSKIDIKVKSLPFKQRIQCKKAFCYVLNSWKVFKAPNNGVKPTYDR